MKSVKPTAKRPIVLGLCLLAVGCEENANEPSKATAAASALALHSPLTQPTASGAGPTPEPIDTSRFIQRPRSDSELVLTDRLRSDIEAAFPKAKGFIDVRTIEEKLVHADIPRGKESKAIQMFDAQAKGKWVLLAGHVANPTDKGFQFGVRYTPRDPRPTCGKSSTATGNGRTENWSSQT